MNVKLLTEHHSEFLSFKGGCKGSSESTLDKMPHCWKSRVAAHLPSPDKFKKNDRLSVQVELSINTDIMKNPVIQVMDKHQPIE